MEKALYIHGLGGSGTGSSAANVRKALEGIYDVVANTYNHLDPLETFAKIKEDAENVDVIIASSLGAFYALSLDTIKPILVLNPCVCPKKVIPGLLREDQKKDYDEEKCFEEWDILEEGWADIDSENCAMRFAVFSDKDEYFSFEKEFIENFKNLHYGLKNTKFINGTHEIAKHTDQLKQAFSAFFKYLAELSDADNYGSEQVELNESHLQEKYLNMFFNSGDARQEQLINANFDEIWEILDKAYAYTKNNQRGKGGPGGFTTKKDLYADCLKSNAMVKCIKSGGGKMQAVAIYNLNRGGRKLSLIGGDCEWNPEKGKYVATEDGKKALYKIIKEDIKESGRNFWGEISDAAEILYFFKTNAQSIPQSVVEALMPGKGIQNTSHHEPVKRDKSGNEYENRFDKDYYERPIDGNIHRKVAVTAPENVDKVQNFPLVRYKKRGE